MKTKVLAVVLIVLGIGATLGGVYGQVFLAEDDGHHDDREPTFALQSQLGADELVVTSPRDNAIDVEIERAGQPAGLKNLHGDSVAHLFVVDTGFTYFEHRPVAGRYGENLDTLAPVPSGELRVVAQASLDNGPDLLEMGATVTVEGEPLDEQNITDDDVWTDGSITVTRQGFDFVLSETWNGDDVYDGPAFLSLFRAEDFAYSHAHAEVVGANRFSFATDLPGLGDYLAALEFEQDGELVTALFRFTL